MPSLAALRAPTKEALYGSASQPSPSTCERVLHNQSTYAHATKLVYLCVVAVAHVLYMFDFLSAFAAYDDHSARALRAVPPSDSLAGHVRHLMLLLLDYKKNMWMTVGAMCVSLSTTCFLLHLRTGKLPQRSYFLSIARVVDVLAFAAVPALLAVRAILSSRIVTLLPSALDSAAALNPPHDFLSQLHCSIVPREQLPLCSVVMERAIFPVVVLEYLIVLAVLTLAYIGLAYLIEYCIRHFFPPSQKPMYTPAVAVP